MFASSSDLLFGSHAGHLQAKTPLTSLSRFAEPPLFTVFGGKRSEKALRVAIVPAGTYVLAGRTFNGNYTDSFCFGAPLVRLAPGEIAYVGDYEMFGLAKMPDGERRNAMRYGSDLEGARTDFAAAYPALASRLTAWTPTNGATFACDGDEFTAYAIPDAARSGSGSTAADAPR